MYRNIPIKDSGNLFTCYEAIASLTAEMVSTTEVGNWEVVNTLEHESAAYVDTLRRSKPYPQLSRADMERKCTLLVCILEDNARVRAMVYPRLGHLRKRVDTARRVANASDAYGGMTRYQDDASCNCPDSVKQCSDLRASAWLCIWYTIASY